MATSPKRVCWDACTWIALIQEEKIVEQGINRVTRCRAVITAAGKGKMEVVTSALSLAEVCKNKQFKDSEPDKVAAFFEHDYLLVVNLGREIGERARELMMSGLPGLKPADACHVATACIAPDVTALHTFDERLLKLDGKVSKRDNTPLIICLPDFDDGASTAPLFGPSGS